MSSSHDRQLGLGRALAEFHEMLGSWHAGDNTDDQPTADIMANLPTYLKD